MSSPAVHSVHIYYEHAALIKRLCGIVCSALQIGNSVLVVATASHREQLVKELTDGGTNVRDHAREGRFLMFDAEEMLSTFMRNGMPDRDLFNQSVGGLLKEARNKARSKDAGLTVFGEMVAVLWEQDQKKAALELESLWNATLNDRAFHLHCAYPHSGFRNDGTGSSLAEVCQSHSHILMDKKYRRAG